jgi:TolB-like protein/DNA-binding winged helix-turn-helix (wHTH) protein
MQHADNQGLDGGTTLQETYLFGQFRLSLARRSLDMSGNPVPLSARAFDMLQVLIESRDRVLSRDEIMARVWPGQSVEPSNLTVQMSTLRRALGDTGEISQWIATVQGRGYRFIGTIDSMPAEAPLQPCTVIDVAPPPVPPQNRLPWWRIAVAAGLVALAGLAALAVTQLRPRAGRPPPLSIVVMPMRDLSDGGGKQYLADAISDDLTTDLSHIPGSLVIARESADAYKGRAVPAGEVGRALNVRYLLEGSLRAEGSQLRINAQLIDTRNGAHIWAERFVVPTDRLLDAQNEIVRRIAGALDVALIGAEAALAAQVRPTNLSALDHFYRGRSILDHGAALGQLSAAQRELEQAVAADPDFVEALATLGWLLVLKQQGFEYATQAQDDAEAARVIGHALVLSPHNPTALSARGRFLAASGRCAEAIAAFDITLQVDPANLHALWGIQLCAWRNGEAARVVPALQAILRINPQGPDLERGTRLLGMARLFSGDAAGAVADLLRAEALEAGGQPDVDNPTQAEMTETFLIAGYALLGNQDEARRRYAAFRTRLPRRSVWRLTALFTPAQTRVPAFAGIADALVQAGMPRFSDPTRDDGLAPGTAPLQGGEFSATPRGIPGGETIDTARLRQLLAARPAPLIVDVGRRMRVPPGALLVSDDGPAAEPGGLDAPETVSRLAASRGGVVVMETGSAGVDGYNAALHLIANGLRPVYWYRGGEEAWAAAGWPGEDRRGE